MSSSPIKDKIILILGGTGSLGHTLTNRYLSHNKVVVFSRGENAQWHMAQKFKSNPNLQFVIGDVRDRNRLGSCIGRYKPNIVIIAAALKHVDVCESNVEESIETNILGVRNVVEIISTMARSGTASWLESVLFVSSDKACAPVNVYGMSKALGERLVAEHAQETGQPKFVNVRYGNVISSRGSVIPYFQTLATDPKTDAFPLTSPDMTRYFMTLEDSAVLIDYALTTAQSGETVVPKDIRSHNVIDIARHFSELHGKPIKIIGIRPGEKIHEVLISATESLRTIERDNFYIIKPSSARVEDPVNFPDTEFSSRRTVALNKSIFLC